MVGEFHSHFPIDTVTWDQFQQAFRTAHVSAGAMAMKKYEFRNLRKEDVLLASMWMILVS